MWELTDSPESRLIKSFDAGYMLHWQLSQYSCFSPDDTLVLVCGLKSYDDLPIDAEDYKAGVGAVFSVPS